MVELVDTQDLKSCAPSRERTGSIPVLGTNKKELAYGGLFFIGTSNPGI